MAQQRYHVIERIDAGGMAEVFKANSTSLQGFEKLVAIKRILPDLTKNERFVRMFLDEAKVSLHLSHTNCVQVFDLGLADGTYFIVMEFVDGTNLKNIIENLKSVNESLTVEQSAYVALEVCKGLAHAHNKIDQQHQHLAIVHRDISPPNVLLSREGEVKITDFGLAKAKSQVESTDPGIVKGKFGYLSPEAAHGEEVDARTDIFAVGILMWEMLTGERLFLGDTDIETLQHVRKNKIPALSKYRSDVPPELEKIIRKALASDINTRYQTAKDLAKDIATFLFQHGKPVTAFDIATQVGRTLETKSNALTEKDKAIAEAVQDAVNRIVSLEEVDDLDLYLAEAYTTQDSEASEEWDGDGSFEDPRMWGDFDGFDEAPVSVRESPVGEEDWQERNLDEIMRRRQTSPGGHPSAPSNRKLSGQPPQRPQVPQAPRAPAQQAQASQPAPLHQRPPERTGGSVEIAPELGVQAEYRPAPAPSLADSTSELRARSQKDSSNSAAMLIVVVLLVLLVAAGAAYVLLK